MKDIVRYILSSKSKKQNSEYDFAKIIVNDENNNEVYYDTHLTMKPNEYKLNQSIVTITEVIELTPYELNVKITSTGFS